MGVEILSLLSLVIRIIDLYLKSVALLEVIVNEDLSYKLWV